MQRNLSELVREWVGGRFSMRSGYYAGRPPSPSDLDSDILESIYTGIKKQVGDEAATAFARFVNKLNDLSASSFIVAFERFWAKDCKMVDVAQETTDRTRLDGYGDALHAQAFAVVAQALSGPRMSEDEILHASNWVKGKFINKHEKEIPDDEKRPFASAYR